MGKGEKMSRIPVANYHDTDIYYNDVSNIFVFDKGNIIYCAPTLEDAKRRIDRLSNRIYDDFMKGANK